MSELQRVPKLCGADVELGNFTLGPARRGDPMRDASQTVLGHIAAAGVAASTRGDDAFEDTAQDRARTFLRTNGGCAYIDLDHLELCLPEVVSAYDHVACWHAMLRITRAALAAANSERTRARTIKLLVNNSDGHGHSYGSHLNVLLTRTAWQNIVSRKPHYLAYLAAFQACSLPLTGQGKVGSENGAPWVAYQLSQRADFFETVQGSQTTWYRPLVNTRDEPLCGRSAAAQDGLARLHIIFFDSTLCHVASLLRVGMAQLVTAMIEAGRVDSTVALEDPLAAVGDWSRDPGLRTRALLVSGEAVTALQLQRRFLEQAQRFVDAGDADAIVPRADDILALWEDTLVKLERRDWPALAPRLDWVLKRALLTRALAHRPELDWRSPEIKHLDLIYSSLDPAEGLYWSVAQQGLIEQVVTEEQIARFMVEPPRDTRAWGRTMLLRRAPHAVAGVDWDYVRLKIRNARGRDEYWRVDFPDPLSATETLLPETTSLVELLDACGADVEPRPRRSGALAPPMSGWWHAGVPHSGAIGLARLRQTAEWNPRKDQERGGDDGSE